MQTLSFVSMNLHKDAGHVSENALLSAAIIIRDSCFFVLGGVCIDQ